MSRRIVVAAGTHGQPFVTLRAAAELLVQAGHSVLWQHGSSAPIPGAANALILEHARLGDEMRRAEAVVVGASPGLLFQAVTRNDRVVCLARRKAAGEHVDDHQLLFAAWVATTGYGTVAASSGEVVAELDRLFSTGAVTGSAQRAADRLRSQEATYGARVWETVEEVLRGD